MILSSDATCKIFPVIAMQCVELKAQKKMQVVKHGDDLSVCVLILFS